MMLSNLAFFFGMLGKELLDFLLTVDTAEEFLNLDLTLQLHQAIKHSLWTRGTSGNKYIHRKDTVHSRHYTI